MINLSVNVNKIATLRNSRGGNIPNLLFFTKLAIESGVQGITVHPRPDERHITFQDVLDIKSILPKSIEFNIEGYPDERLFRLVSLTKPDQVTLVPDKPGQLTSDHGWIVSKHEKQLQKIISRLHSIGTRVSLFMDCDHNEILCASRVGADRIEFYTGSFAVKFNTEEAEYEFSKFNEAAIYADSLGLEINAGHDLNTENLKMFRYLHNLKEVSIGHAIVSEALEKGWKATIENYLEVLKFNKP